MASELTLSIIKPDAVRKNKIGEILTRFESAGLKVVAARLEQLSSSKAEGFYAEHQGKPFFDALITFMTSGPCLLQVLEGENAVNLNRDLMGATNPQEAKEGTIRKMHGISIDKNSVHGSDSLENARVEIDFFFRD